MVYKYSSYIYSSILSISLLLGSVDTQAASTYAPKMDSTTSNQQAPTKKSRIKDNGSIQFSNLHFGFKPFSPVTGTQKPTGGDNEKLLSNVKVFPNQISDQINLSFKLNKDTNVSIKVMDALGNEVTTLFSQRVAAGEQTNSFNIANKLNQGFYFIRVVAGTETIVKRIEVL